MSDEAETAVEQTQVEPVSVFGNISICILIHWPTLNHTLSCSGFSYHQFASSYGSNPEFIYWVCLFGQTSARDLSESRVNWRYRTDISEISQCNSTVLHFVDSPSQLFCLFHKTWRKTAVQSSNNHLASPSRPMWVNYQSWTVRRERMACPDPDTWRSCTALSRFALAICAFYVTGTWWYLLLSDVRARSRHKRMDLVFDPLLESFDDDV